MKTPKKQKQVVKGKDEQIMTEVKDSPCCGPTCCSSADKKESNRKEK